MLPNQSVTSLSRTPRQPEEQDPAAASSSGSAPRAGTQARPTPPAGIPARPAVLADAECRSKRIRTILADGPIASSTHPHGPPRRAGVPAPTAQANVASPSSAQTRTDLPGRLPTELWLDVAGSMNQDTRSAFRLVCRAAAAVGKQSVQGLMVRNSNDLALALKAHESAKIAKLSLDHGEFMNLQGKGFTDADLKGLPPSLRELSVIYSSGITAAGLAQLNNLPRLESLTLQGCEIGDEGARFLAGITSITSLVLTGCSIGAEGARALAGSTSITSLNLSGNNIGDEGAGALAENTSITSLVLTGCRIGAEDETSRCKTSTISLRVFWGCLTLRWTRVRSGSRVTSHSGGTWRETPHEAISHSATPRRVELLTVTPP
jgi:hypothetical protein